MFLIAGLIKSLLQPVRETRGRPQTIRSAQLKQVSVDTTVQPKAVAFPTDARLYWKGLRALVRAAKREGLVLRQSDTRLARQAFLQYGRYAKAPEWKRALNQFAILLGDRVPTAD
ncbi:MAG: hypothetical protein KDE53_30225 [Caldilineaceae bacterium]|nr:hypothetical protein [Caldilineaceae bacterium]